MPMTVGELLALIRADDSQFSRTVDRAENKLRRAAGRMQLDMTKLWTIFTKVAGLAARGVALVVLASVAATATMHVLSLVAGLGALAGLLAAVPALIVAVAAPIAALKIGLAGVGDALKGDADALAKLAPQARAVVTEIRALAGAWGDVRRMVQGALFAPLRGEVAALARTWLPVLRIQLGGVAAELGLIGREAATAARHPAFVTALTDSLVWLRTLLAENRGAIGHLVSAFGTLLGAITPIIGAGDGFLQLANSFREWVEAAAESGRLAEIWQSALTVAGQLGDVLLQVGGIIGSVMDAAQAAGGGTLGTLAEVLRSINGALSSSEGQAGLVAVFGALLSVAQQVGPIIAGLLSTLGPGLSAALAGLAMGLAALAPAAEPVGRALSAILTAAAPLLPLLGGALAAVLTVVAGVVSTLAAEAGPLLDLLSQLGTQILALLVPALQQLVDGGLPMAVELGQALFDALLPLLPVILQMAETFLSILVPALRDLQTVMSAELLPVLKQAALDLGVALLDALKALAPHIPDLARAGVELARAMLQVMVALVPLLPLLVQLLTLVIGDGDTLVMGIRAAAFAATTMAAAIRLGTESLQLAVSWFRRSIEIGKEFGAAIVSASVQVLTWLSDVGRKIQDVFSSAGSWLRDAGRRVIDGLLDGISSGFQRVKDKLGQLTSLLPDWKGPADLDRRILRPSGRLLMAGLMEGIASQLPRLRGQLGDITLRMPDMVTSPASRAAGDGLAGIVAAVTAAARGREVDPDAFARAVRAALADLSVQMDGREVGRLQGREADLYARV